MEKYIKVRGARQHNLQNVDLDIPKDRLVVFTGVSGSGKSSMAFDTIYAEGQRRYVESLSTYARQFLGVMGKPDVDHIEGLSPAISIDQKTVSHNPRSTVGTVTEIYDYMRLLFARVGHPHCPICGREIASQSLDQIVAKIMVLVEEQIKRDKMGRYFIISPVIKDRKGEFSALFENLKAKGFRRVRIDGHVRDLQDDLVLIKTNKHTIEVIVDRLAVTAAELKDEVAKNNFVKRMTDSIEQSLSLSNGLVKVSRVLDASFEMPEFPKEFEDHLFSEAFACPVDNIELPEIEPRTFSFNSPHGACPECAGIGRILKVNEALVFAPELSIKEGGIIPFSSIFEHDTWFSRILLTVCEENNINASTAIKNLTAEEKKIILQGTGKRTYRVFGRNRMGKETSISEEFHGVTAELDRRYRESDSDYVKNAIEKYMVEQPCPECKGKRLKPEALAITIEGQSISDVCDLSIAKSLAWVTNLTNPNVLSNRETQIGTLVIKEARERLGFLIDVGLDYITLSRAADTLSGGEAQRIRLASQIGSGLTGVLYVLDEPTIGLHPRDNVRLIETLKRMRELGNSVVVVEHDRDVMLSADYIFDFGPAAGKHGGTVVAQGTPEQLMKDSHSVTGPYLADADRINIRKPKPREGKGILTLSGARQFNLKNLTLKIPLGKLTAVSGVSGSGKSTLVVETLYHALQKELLRNYRHPIGEYDQVHGVEGIDKAILIDQSPIGRTPRSNPATYTKVFDLIRDVFSGTREAKAMGFKKGRFSFNVKGGRCEACEGQGQVKIEMQFMPDLWVTCEVCKGARFNSQTLEVLYKGKNIAEVLKMTVAEAKEFFHVYPNITAKIETLSAVGLDYMELGQSATTLSGGEAQRVKLATELARKATGNTIYILDEPTTGLHFKDLEKLLAVLNILVERGNTIVVVEHNLDVIKNADFVVDMGPEGGENGGYIVAQGTPDEIRKDPKSVTGVFL